MKNQKVSLIQKISTQVASPQTWMFIILILGVLVFFTLFTPNHSYLKIENLNNILTDSVIPAIFAFGMGIIIAGGGFDLSLGHIASMVASIIAYLMSGGVLFDPVSAVFVGLVVAAVVGLGNGLLVSRMGISSFIVTLGMQFLIIGVRQIITGGQSVYISNEPFKALADNQLGLSNLVLILVGVSALIYLLMEKSTFGRKVQFTGANIEASKFMGIHIKNFTMYTFILGAVLAGFGGALFAARAGAVQINSVDSKLLDAITIAVFASVIFGRFRTGGIVLVAILISMIGTGMSMMGIKTEWIEVVKGFILLSSIFLARIMNSKTAMININVFLKSKGVLENGR
jgi:ribose transport system permease protein